MRVLERFCAVATYGGFVGMLQLLNTREPVSVEVREKLEQGMIEVAREVAPLEVQWFEKHLPRRRAIHCIMLAYEYTQRYSEQEIDRILAFMNKKNHSAGTLAGNAER